MKGIADGAADAGGEAWGRPIDLRDIVALNSVVDLGQLEDALEVTPNSLTGQAFASPDEELDIDVDEDGDVASLTYQNTSGDPLLFTNCAPTVTASATMPTPTTTMTICSTSRTPGRSVDSSTSIRPPTSRLSL